MKRRRITKLNGFELIAIHLLVLAFFLDQLDKTRLVPSGPWWDLSASLILIFLAICWGFSLHHRIVQVQAGIYLQIVAALIIFWYTIRTIRWRLTPASEWEGIPQIPVSDSLYPLLNRALWYIYYAPMMLIPTLVVLVAISIGRPADYRLPKLSWLYIAFNIGLIVFVLTNDFHQKVFIFPEDKAAWSDSNFMYGKGFVFYVVCLSLSYVLLFAILTVRCRIPGNSKKILIPSALTLGLVLYIYVYYKVGGVRMVFAFQDLTAMFCIFYVLIIESCIRLGFIQSNSHYWELFHSIKRLPILITDRDFQVRYRTGPDVSLSVDKMKLAEKDPLVIEYGKILHSSPIRSGHAVWIEDQTELFHLREELRSIQEELKDRNEMLRLSYEKEKEYHATQEQIRLYGILLNGTRVQNDKIRLLLQRYRRSEDPEEKATILREITVLGSYIKRRKDFYLSIDSAAVIPVQKLRNALAESYHSLSLLGVHGAYFVGIDQESISGNILTRAYDFFEDAVEVSMETLRNISIRVAEISGTLRAGILADGDGDFSVLKKKYPDAYIRKHEDGTDLILNLKEGAD